MLDGIRLGFHVGLEPHRVSLRSRSSNMRSALDHAEVVDEYLSAELAAGRLAGPFNHLPIPSLQVSPFGVIPKNHQPGKWRLIRSLVDLGPGALMAKFDVKAAYRNIPIHPDDRYLLGMKWRDRFYVDLVLPFGLRSAPFIFNSVAEAVEWILVHNYLISPLFHYLDDYLTMGPPNSPQCQSLCGHRIPSVSAPGASFAS